MINGINYITDERGKQKGILLDLTVFNKDSTKATAVLEALAGLQQLIDQAGSDTRKDNNWDVAKMKLKNLKP